MPYIISNLLSTTNLDLNTHQEAKYGRRYAAQSRKTGKADSSRKAQETDRTLTTYGFTRTTYQDANSH
jgi:hypothetical protein